MKCNKVKNPCKICFQSVSKKNGLQCQGACQKWAHFKCLNYTPGKIQDIKAGVIKITCPCPDCNTSLPKEILADPPFTCTNTQCPANKLPSCNSECPTTCPISPCESPASSPCPPPRPPCPPPKPPCPPPRPQCPPPRPQCPPPRPQCPPPRSPCPPPRSPCPPPRSPCPPPRSPCPPPRSPCPPPRSPCPPPRSPCPPCPRSPCPRPRTPTPPRRTPTPPRRTSTPPRRTSSPPRKLTQRVHPRESQSPSPPTSRSSKPKLPPCFPPSPYSNKNGSFPCPPSCPPTCPSYQKNKNSKKSFSPKQSQSCSDVSNASSSSARKYDKMRSISSDSKLPSAGVDPKTLFTAIESLCATVGQLSNQLRNLMCKIQAGYAQ